MSNKQNRQNQNQNQGAKGSLRLSETASPMVRRATQAALPLEVPMTEPAAAPSIVVANPPRPAAPSPMAAIGLTAVQAAELERLRAENERLRASIAAEKKAPPSLSLKITEKGGLSIYGLGRFPVTLYKAQWLRLLAVAEQIKAFIEEHASELSVKE